MLYALLTKFAHREKETRRARVDLLTNADEVDDASCSFDNQRILSRQFIREYAMKLDLGRETGRVSVKQRVSCCVTLVHCDT